MFCCCERRLYRDPDARKRGTGRRSFSTWVVARICVPRIREASVTVEGPYVGRSGISFSISEVEESRVKLIELICQTVQDASQMLRASDPRLASCPNWQISLVGRLFRFSLSHFITWSSNTPHSSKQQSTVLSRQRYQMNDIDTPSGLLVGICGLVNLVESVHAAVSKVGTQRTDEVGYSRHSYGEFRLYESLDLQKVVPLETAVAYCQDSNSPVDEEHVTE
ncbi:hypothetical protein EV368DRAFT_61160 [Lentinula lateritia]|nr:hypothetical protein EV368DRAFT_61160 [Lentinula lateritia]